MPSTRLHPGETERFRETQRLWRNPIVGILLPVESVLTTAVLVAVGTQVPPQERLALALVGVFAAIILPGLIACITLTTVVTNRRVVLAWWPPLPGREIAFDRVRSAEPVRYSPLGDAGGWGWRRSPRFHRVFNVSGDRGVHLRWGDAPSEQILIGSRDADRLAAALRPTAARP